jgi:cell division protein FtsA
MGISGLPEMGRGAAFATVAGMLIYPQVCAQEFAEPRQAAKLTGTDGYFARVGNWLKTSF